MMTSSFIYRRNLTCGDWKVVEDGDVFNRSRSDMLEVYISIAHR